VPVPLGRLVEALERRPGDRALDELDELRTALEAFESSELGKARAIAGIRTWPQARSALRRRARPSTRSGAR
jgi:hypothetical protein